VRWFGGGFSLLFDVKENLNEYIFNGFTTQPRKAGEETKVRVNFFQPLSLFHLKWV
jgi:hypothetical protein